MLRLFIQGQVISCEVKFHVQTFKASVNGTGPYGGKLNGEQVLADIMKNRI